MTTHNNQPPQERDYPVAVAVDEGMLQVTLKDGRMIATPLAWYPRLQDATSEQLAHVELGITGIYWPDLDEDLSVAGMLRGVRPPQAKTAAHHDK